MDENEELDTLVGVSKTQVQKSRSEMKNVLKKFEEEYRTDLAVHLYSTHLLHRMDPLFPRSQWASWPLDVEEVPVPKTTRIYVQEPDEECGGKSESVSSDYQPPPKIKQPGRKRKAKFISNEFVSDEEEEEVDVESVGEEYLEEEDVEIVEERPDPKEPLKIEIERLFKRSVHNKLKEPVEFDWGTENVEINIDELRLPSNVCDEMFRKLDTLLARFDLGKKIHERKDNNSFFGWAEILNESEVRDQQFIKKMADVFANEPVNFLDGFRVPIEGNDDDDEQGEAESAQEAECLPALVARIRHEEKKKHTELLRAQKEKDYSDTFPTTKEEQAHSIQLRHRTSQLILQHRYNQIAKKNPSASIRPPIYKTYDPFTK